MIRAENLMIGDWVLCDGEQYQISEIGGMVCIDAKEQLYAFLEDIEPIPLTPEILEKNTTESNKNIFGGMNYALDADYFIENRGHRFCLSRLMAGHKYSTFWVCDIHYVHQLQHALKLCNINLEIKI